MAKGKGGSEGDNKENNKNGENFLNIVLKIHLHCDGCTQRIRKHLLNFPGVLKVEFEGENKVKIMAAKNVDIQKLKDKLQKKTLKQTEIVSPQPPKNDEKKNQNNNQKPKESPVTTVVLKVAVHCQGCGERLYKTLASVKVKVTGRVDEKKLVEEVRKKLKKHVEIAKEKGKQNEKEKEKKKENENEEKGKKEENGGDKKQQQQIKVEYLVNGSGYIGLCDGSGRVLEIFDPPPLFSDDNPHACSIM
ncbi:Heavy metal-associated isoprenylated plant protein 8 [Bienertia sinuspersici]